MAITYIQDRGQYSGASSSVTVHLTTNTTATDTLLAAFCLPAGASVISVNDNILGRWIQAGNQSVTGSPNVELWHSRGIQGGNASVTAVFSTASVGCNVSEWSNCWFQSPLDTWAQNTATSNAVTPQTVFPRTTGELVISVGNSAASVSGAPSGWTALSVPGNTGFSAAYQILSGSVVPAMHWTASGASAWAAVQAAYLPVNSVTVGAGTGGTGVNPLLQFPETLIQLSETSNYLANFQGVGSWTDVSSYLESFSIGPMGRQHELDRVQATSGQFVMNGRDGTFNSWNTSSFLYPGGLDPMTPIRVVGAWNGVTSPIAFLYAQSFDPNIIDAQNVTVTISAYDILQMLSLGYLANNNYAQAVIAGN